MRLTVITRLLISVLILQTSRSAVMRLDYGTGQHYVILRFNTQQFDRFQSCMVSTDAGSCELPLRNQTAPFTYDVAEVRKEMWSSPASSTTVPKYICSLHSRTNSVKCEKIKILVTCKDVKAGDLFGISWRRHPEEYLSHSSLSNSTYSCLGEYGSNWAVIYYRSAANPNSLRQKSTNLSFNQPRVTVRVNEDSMTYSADVETSTMTNVFTTEEVQTSSSVSLAVIVVCSVLGVVIILIIAIVSYCLICRRKRGRAREITKSEINKPPRYEEVIIPLDCEDNETVVKRPANNNFGGISAIYSYPYPSSVNKRFERQPTVESPDRANLADYSRPVDSYHDPKQIKQNGRSLSTDSDAPRRSKNSYKLCDDSQTSEYSNPDDALDDGDEDSFMGQKNLSKGDYTELESVTYSEREEPPHKASMASQHEYADPNTCVPHRMLNGGSGQTEVREYNKLGEEQRHLLHSYDHFEADQHPAVYSVAKIV
ncbi:hypothetical protein Btru_055618 [Bulinus truncatus]|nr:hypothetical protein Btru_055618 [Bulinus truncatus]